MVVVQRLGLLLLTAAGVLLLSGCTSHGLELKFPTPNRALMEDDGNAAFYQPTVEGTTLSGMFGCVRRDGRRFHEGIDIKCLEWDRSGEPLDPVFAIAGGQVVFVNAKSGLSNYGRYVVVEHQWDGITVFSLYAHLRQIVPGLKVQQLVQPGERIGTVGRSTNSREGISRDRAHLHFEIGFLLNPEFDRWYRRRAPKRPPFGRFNGQNLFAIDPAALFRAVAEKPSLRFDEYLWSQPLGFTVLVPARRLPWLAAHRTQLAADDRHAVAYEVGVTAWGTPLHAWPRTAAEIGQGRLPRLNLVNPDALLVGNCRQLVREETATGRWRLTDAGREWLELLTYVP